MTDSPEHPVADTSQPIDATTTSRSSSEPSASAPPEQPAKELRPSDSSANDTASSDAAASFSDDTPNLPAGDIDRNAHASDAANAPNSERFDGEPAPTSSPRRDGEKAPKKNSASKRAASTPKNSSDASDNKSASSTPPSSHGEKAPSSRLRRPYRSATLRQSPKSKRHADDSTLDDDEFTDDFFFSSAYLLDDPEDDPSEVQFGPPSIPVPMTRLSSEQLLQRRTKLRRVVLYVLAAATVISLIALATTVLSPSKKESSTASNDADATSAHLSMPGIPPPASVASKATAAPFAAVDDAAAAQDATPLDEPSDASADVSSGEPEVDAADALVESDAAIDAAKALAESLGDEVDLKKLRIETERALNRSKWDEAVSLCEKGLKADPEDARWYLFLGTALQGKGQASQAAAVFKECVEKATRGAKHECRMFAR